MVSYITLWPQTYYVVEPCRHNFYCIPCKDYPSIIQKLISLSPYLVAIQTGHCNAYSKYLLSECCVNIAPYLFYLSIKTDQPMTVQRRE